MFNVNPLFQNALPKLTDEEFRQLEENIVSDGEVYEPLTIWNNTIVDGHNRWAIIQKHPGIPYTTRNVEFGSELEAVVWIYKNQLGKRNLKEIERTYALGKRYEAEKLVQGGDRKSSCGNRNLIGKRTCEAIAEEQGVSPTRVNDAYSFSKAVDKADDLVPGFREAVVSAKTNASRKEIMSLNKMNTEQVEEAAKRILNGDKIKEKQSEKKNTGGSAVNRKNMQEIRDIVAEMYSTETKPFTIEMLEGDVEINGNEYVNMLRSTLIERSTLLVGENRVRIRAKVDEIINKIQNVKEILA